MRICQNCHITFASTDWMCASCGHRPVLSDGVPMFAPHLDARDDAYNPNRFAYIDSVERTHFWFGARMRLIVDAIEAHFPGAGTLLEVGCGTGFVLSQLQSQFPRMQVTGSEIHLQGLGYARHRLPGVELLQADATALPFSGEFDVICAFDVIEHIVDDRAALRSMYASCRTGGGVILTVPQHSWLWSIKDDFARHKRRYSRRELAGKLREAGFRVVATHSFVSLLLPVLWLSRLYDRHGTGFDPAREFSFSPRVNAMFGKVMALERLTVRAGVAWPAGGSLLAVALKDSRAGDREQAAQSGD